MAGIFDNVQFAKYKPTSVRLPVEQFINTAAMLNQQYEQAVEGMDRIQSFLSQTTVDEVNQPALKEIANNISSDLKSFTDKGNLEDASLAIKETANKHITNNPLFKGIVTDYTNRQAFLKSIEEGLAKGDYLTPEYAYGSYKLQKELYGSKPVTIGENGEIQNVFKGTIPPKEISLSKMIDDVTKDIQTSTSVSELKHSGLAYYYNQITAEERTPERIKEVATSYVLGDPGARSYMQYQTMLEYYNKFGTITAYKGDTPVVTPEALQQVGLTVVTPDTKIEVDEKGNPLYAVGDVITSAGMVEIKDAKGIGTGKYKPVYNNYGNISTITPEQASNLWQNSAFAKQLNMPIAMAIGKYQMYKPKVEWIKDEVGLAALRHRYALEEKQYEKQLNSTPGLSITTTINGPTTGLKSLQDVKNSITDLNTKFEEDLTKYLSSSGLSVDQQSKVKGVFKAQLDPKYANLPQETKNKIYEQALTLALGSGKTFKERDAIRGYMNLFESVSNKRDFYNRVMEDAFKETGVSKDVYESYFSTKIDHNLKVKAEQEALRIVPFSEAEGLFPNSEFANRQREAREKMTNSAYADLLKKNNPDVAKLNAYFEDRAKNPMVTRTLRAFGNLSADQDKYFRETMSSIINSGATENGVLSVRYYDTKEQITSKDRANLLQTADYKAFFWDRADDGTTKLVVRIPTTNSKGKSLERFVEIGGINGLDNWIQMDNSLYGINRVMDQEWNVINGQGHDVDLNISFKNDTPGTIYRARTINDQNRPELTSYQITVIGLGGTTTITKPTSADFYNFLRGSF